MVPPLHQQILAGVLLVAVVVLLVRSSRSPQARPDPRGAVTIGHRPTVDSVVVDISGAVRHQGIYSLPAAARVNDALQRAGGLTAEADIASVNRAAPLVDGQKIVVAARGAAGAGATAGAVSLNAATAVQLAELDSIGPIMAQRIVDDRTAKGPFKSIDELDRVAGVGPATVESLRASVTL